MILNRPLTPEEMRTSQRFYNLYSAVNGMSYMCLGDTILILFALRLKCHDAVISALGAMVYVGFLFLPLGKWMTARTGAVRSQADFWVLRNIASLFIAAAAPLAACGWRGPAVFLLVAGSLVFYGCRAAGIVMSQPLIGEVCPPGTRGRVIARSWMFFYAAGFLALLVITVLLRHHPGANTICGIIITGAFLGIASSFFMRAMCETGEIRDAARRPVFREYRRVLGLPAVRRQIYAGIVCYAGVILTVPISLLTVKKGFLAADTQALVFSMVQLFASVPANYLLSRVSDRFGGKVMIAGGYLLICLLALYWIVVPAGFSWGFLLVPFFVAACGNVCIANALAQYFLETVPKEAQVSASIFISIASGALAGLLGLASGGLLLRIASALNGSARPLATYRIYFLLVLLLLAVLSVPILRLDDPRKKKA